jgi:hypothetical protein
MTPQRTAAQLARSALALYIRSGANPACRPLIRVLTNTHPLAIEGPR